MNLGKVLVAALVAGAAPFAVPLAQAAPVAVSDQAELKSLSDQIAALVVDEATVPDQVDRFLDAGLDAMVKQDAGIQKLEKAYPGMVDAMRVAWRPVLLKSAHEVVPPYRAELSQMYQDNLTLGEARQLLTFFSSPEFRSFIKVGRANIDYRETAKSVASSDELSGAAIKSDLAAAGRRSEAQMTPAQRRKLESFMLSPLGRKVVGLSSKKLQIDQKWANFTSPEVEKEIEAVTYQTMLTHIGKTDPATAKRMRDTFEEEGLLPKQK